MSDDLTFGPDNDPTPGTLHGWRLDGPRGAITFRIGLATSIEMHSRSPLYEGDEPLTGCSIGFPCYADGSGLRGRELATRWRAAGKDDAVIRTELAAWYASLPKLAVTW